jgi:hypothetical protein
MAIGIAAGNGKRVSFFPRLDRLWEWMRSSIK